MAFLNSFFEKIKLSPDITQKENRKLEPLIFQVHITTEKLQDEQRYFKVCEANNVKPVLIKLEQGDFCDQPMFTAKIKADTIDYVLKETEKLKDTFEKNGFKTIRVKIEIDAMDIMAYFKIDMDKWMQNKYAENSSYHSSIYSQMENTYFECHIKIRYNDIETLKKISMKHNFYLSQNDIETNVRFLSFRQDTRAFINKNPLYISSHLSSRNLLKEYLGQRCGIGNLQKDLEKYNMEIVKEKFELCVYDSKKNLDKNWGHEIDYKKLSLEIKEELMIYISNDLPFITKGSFLTSQFHTVGYERLENGGDIDLIYHNSHSVKPKIFDYDSCHIFLRAIETTLQLEIIDIFYKLEEIISAKLDPLERPEFIVEYEQLGYDKIFKEGICTGLYLVNYASDGDFTTIGIEIDSDKIVCEIDIAIDMPVAFEPETIVYKTLDNKNVVLKNTSPLLYQTAWKMHQMIARPRLKDMDDIIRFLPHLDFQNEENFNMFFNEIIKECKLSDEKTCKNLIENLGILFSGDILNYINENFHDSFFGSSAYYHKLYAIEDKKELKEKVCDDFYKSIHKHINCVQALKYINSFF